MPSQIKAEDDEDEITLPMPPRFQERIDHLAMQRGLGSGDEYLAQWEWSEEEERPGSAREVAEALMAELERKVPA